jgi:hypothetical protein
VDAVNIAFVRKKEKEGVNMNNQKENERERRVQETRAKIVEQQWQSSKLPFADPVHLAANSQGQLTPEQIQVLAKEKASQTASCGGGCGFFSIVCICLLLVFLFKHDMLLSFIFFLLAIILMGFSILCSKQAPAEQKSFQEDLAAGKKVLTVVHLQGVVTWNQERREYCVNLSNARSFPLPHYLPGPYSVYFVEEEAKIVSLMPLHTPTQRELAFLTLQLLLCEILKFDFSDLDANRKGLLSEKQRRKMKCGSSELSPAVQSLEGEILRVITTKPSGSGGFGPSVIDIYEYEIEGYRFHVPGGSPALGALVNRIRYRIYHLAGFCKFLSIEPLELLESPSGLLDTANDAIPAKDDEKMG